MVSNSISHIWRTAKSSNSIQHLLNSIDDKALDEIISMQQRNKTYNPHRAVPIGIPPNAIDRIIIKKRIFQPRCDYPNKRRYR